MNQIREIRERAGIKQVDLYTRLNWPQGRLSNYETGLRTPSLTAARGIVAALNSLGAVCCLDNVFPEPVPSRSAA